MVCVSLRTSVVLCLIAQSCPTLCDHMDCGPPNSSVHGILQARILEWVAKPSSRGLSQPRAQTQVSCIAGRIFTVWATREAHSVSLLIFSLDDLSFMEPISAWIVPLVSLIFLKRSLVFPILLVSSISLHWSLRKAFLFLFAVLRNSELKWVRLSFSPLLFTSLLWGFPCGSPGKEPACNAGDLGLSPGLGRSPGEGKGYLLQYSGLENSMVCGIPWGHKESDTFTSLHFWRSLRNIQFPRMNSWFLYHSTWGSNGDCVMGTCSEQNPLSHPLFSLMHHILI